MNKHTPGTWSINPRLAGTYPVISAGDNRVCIVQSLGKTDDECEANAHLIAAAPDLLDALQDLLAVANVRIDDPRIAKFDAARAAIAKATRGEA